MHTDVTFSAIILYFSVIIDRTSINRITFFLSTSINVNIGAKQNAMF